MTRGQFVTVLTLGAAGAIGLAAVALGAATYFSPRVYSALTFVIGAAVPAGWLAAMVAGGGFAAAVWLVKAQQVIANWLASRELAKMRHLYHEVEMALGTEHANELILYKTRRTAKEAERNHVDLFGVERIFGRSERRGRRAPDQNQEQPAP